MARESAERASDARARFLSTVSHEVRTPIDAVLGYSDLFESGAIGDATAEQRKVIERMWLAARHLLSVVSGVLELAKAEAGHLTLRREPVDLRQVIETAVTLTTPQAESKGITIELRAIDGAIDCIADSDRIRQIFINLLGNAVKFSPKNGRVVVTWGSDREPQRSGDGGAAPVFVSVRDGGPGIAPQDHERIFVPFEQTDRGARDKDGAGLELAISRQLAGMVGGGLSIESQLGHGTILTLRLPAVAPQQAPTGQRDRAEGHRSRH